MMFVAAKIAHLSPLPQGLVERVKRAISLVAAMEKVGFGGRTNDAACEQACPKSIGISAIAKTNRDFHLAMFTSDDSQTGKREGFEVFMSWDSTGSFPGAGRTTSPPFLLFETDASQSEREGAKAQNRIALLVPGREGALPGAPCE